MYSRIYRIEYEIHV